MQVDRQTDWWTLRKADKQKQAVPQGEPQFGSNP